MNLVVCFNEKMSSLLLIYVIMTEFVSIFITENY
jgi:hypothetical protein